MPLTRDSPCVGNLLKGSESVENAPVLALASPLRPSPGADDDVLLLEVVSNIMGVPKARFFRENRRTLRAACLSRLQVREAWRHTLGLDAGREPLIFIT
jgi:hypothetical protein